LKIVTVKNGAFFEKILHRRSFSARIFDFQTIENASSAFETLVQTKFFGSEIKNVQCEKILDSRMTEERELWRFGDQPFGERLIFQYLW